MKTRLISAILACILLVSLVACANEGPGKTPDETTKETTEALTTETTTTQEETTESTASLAFNEDLLSDIGLTYPQLVEKRGERKVTELITVEGGSIGYFFENGYGAYIWGLYEIDYGRELEEGEGYPIPRDENHNIIAEEVQLPKSDIACRAITKIKAKDILSNVSFPLNAADIAGIDGVMDVRTGKDGISSSYDYASEIFYNDSTKRDLDIVIYHNDAGTIDADSEAIVLLTYRR